MKSHLRADAPPDLLHEPRTSLDSHSLGFTLTAEGAQLNAIFAGVAEAIVLVDEEGDVQRINSAFTRIFGYSEEDAVGRPLGALIALDDPLEEVKTHASMASAQSEVVIPETVRRRNDGMRVPVSIIKVPVRSPRTANCWYLIYRDLTERKRLEDELSRERDRLRLLLEITHSMTSKLDLRQLIAVLSTDLLSVMQCDFCALLLPDTDSGELRLTTLYNPEARGALCDGTIIPIHGSICGKAFWTGKTQHFNHFEEVRYDPESFGNEVGRRFYQRVMAEGVVSGCDLPLIGRNGVVGVLAALKRSERAYERNDVLFLEQVARQVAIAVENALEYGKAIEDKEKERAQKRYLQEEIRAEHNFDTIVGESPALKAAMHLVSVVAPTDSSVLILGETGTGKELIARAIHDLSTRRDRAFVKVNCAAIPLGLLESELFGHERGAFTGAIAQKMGRFELANKGTLFLDEVGDIPLELQAKLLRVLQEQEFERLGSNRTHRVDVRLIAATHRDLSGMVMHSTFREDLFYRLRVFPIHVPPLRQRTEDIPELVRHFLALYSRRMNKNIERIPSETMDALVRYRWPGNIRELQNFIERAVILSPHTVLRAPVAELEPSHTHRESDVAISGLAEVERDHIIRALEATHWVVGGRNGAAARLGMKRTSLVYRMQKLGISRQQALPVEGTRNSVAKRG
jgi:formate hydrogenlyase transcriptional activator